MKNILDSVKTAYKALDEHLAENITVIEIGKLTPIADYFIITDGKNENQMRALQEFTEEALAKEGVFPKRIEGAKTDSWVLLDYGDFVVHIFSKEDRQFYNLERLWSDVRTLELSELVD